VPWSYLSEGLGGMTGGLLDWFVTLCCSLAACPACASAVGPAAPVSPECVPRPHCVGLQCPLEPQPPAQVQKPTHAEIAESEASAMRNLHRVCGFVSQVHVVCGGRDDPHLGPKHGRPRGAADPGTRGRGERMLRTGRREGGTEGQGVGRGQRSGQPSVRDSRELILADDMDARVTH
jgi:hypothetical protein